jgi:hypothetical protein
MRYLKAALVGLVGGVLIMTAVFAVDAAWAKRSISVQMAACEAEAVRNGGGGGVCTGAAQFGGNKMPVAFVLGFVAAFTWSMRARRRSIQ